MLCQQFKNMAKVLDTKVMYKVYLLNVTCWVLAQVVYIHVNVYIVAVIIHSCPLQAFIFSII
jgi:hypothetical protein